MQWYLLTAPPISQYSSPSLAVLAVRDAIAAMRYCCCYSMTVLTAARPFVLPVLAAQQTHSASRRLRAALAHASAAAARARDGSWRAHTDRAGSHCRVRA
jgi:hypothetical protein